MKWLAVWFVWSCSCFVKGFTHIHRHNDLQLFLFLRCCKYNWSLQCGLSDFLINISIRYEKQISQCVCGHCGVVSSTALWTIIIILHCPPCWSVFLNGGWGGVLISPADPSWQFRYPSDPCSKMTYEGWIYCSVCQSQPDGTFRADRSRMNVLRCLISPRNDKLYIYHSCHIGGHSL